MRAAFRLLPMVETSCCTLSGPFAQAALGGCECQPGFVKLEAANGRWQCNQPAASGGGEGCPGWVTWVLAACIAVTLCSIAFASAPPTTPCRFLFSDPRHLWRSLAHKLN